ncbi:E3 ubiquitin/ISG15 ligase TRIM25-like isoform X2 [Acipenser ruthenus]|uniref:E3 ubiquitin/ISG15 ligase TRIM25-like isoform X2 n=1 Tax=Acipenser ruthenus TaxID=7906 RepID=UPI0027410E6D|nr:E3 ubiquitin/ISG15 ligase TRIM25-like isoform X2 [Acipenser ruthenus]
MASNLWSQDQFSCPVCLELLKDPVTTACGHSYCMGCIKNYWDQTDHTGVYSCPQCRKTFTPRPDLCRNTMLAEVVEKLKNTGLSPPPAQSYAGPGDVPCDFCTGRKFKALKSCLTCLASYCETHIKPHYEGAAFKRHKLINAIGNLDQKICAEHQKVLEVFCRTDQTCICLLCSQIEHRSHETVSAETQRIVKQKQLGETQTEIQQRIQERLKEIEELKKAVETLKRSACIEIKESEKIFTELIRSIEKIHTEVIELVGANEKAAVNQAEGRMKTLEQEIAELRRRNAELKQLSETEDHIHFLQNFQSLCAPPEAGDLPSVTVNADISFGAVRKAVSELKYHIEDFCKGEIVKKSKTVYEVAVYSLQAPEPRNRAEFLKSKEKCDTEEEGMKKQPEVRRRLSLTLHPNLSGCEASAEEETGETEEQEPAKEKCDTEEEGMKKQPEVRRRLSLTLHPNLSGCEASAEEETGETEEQEPARRAEANILVAHDQFSCPVCLEILKDPVTTACGHSYCMGCIKNCWDHADHTGVYSCPQCRETFTPRPVLCRNTMLAEIVEKLKKTGLNPPPAQSYSGPGDVPCDFCTGRKFKAVKSCLTCRASYCETHVKPHSEVTPLKRHKLINAIGDLEQKFCAEHQKVLEVFCRTDRTCICLLCSQIEHRSHDTVSAEAERSVKQKQLGETQTEIQQRIQERLKETEELEQTVESLKRSACIEIKESEKIFTELIRSIEKIHTEVIELIGANEKAAVNQAEGRMKKLEQEIAELRRRNTELKQLSETEDHIHFLQNFQTLCAPPEAGDLPSVIVNTDISFGAVRKAVSELKDHIEDFCKGELITKTVNEVAVYSLHAPEPRNRAEFLKYSCQLTLDPNTANRELCLSEGNRKVTRGGKTQRYPHHPERFDSYLQVLCREGLSGTRCYWEIEWSGGGAAIGVAYKGISRKGWDGTCGLGCNDNSWSLFCSGSSYSAWHNNNETAITAPRSPRIGVYLDFNAGTLSFYGISDTMTLLHRFQTTFTEPLYPGFYIYSDSSLTICQLN